jgi:hypothetical protein
MYGMLGMTVITASKRGKRLGYTMKKKGFSPKISKNS